MVKCFFCRHEDMSSILSTLIKSWHGLLTTISKVQVLIDPVSKGKEDVSEDKN